MKYGLESSHETVVPHIVNLKMVTECEFMYRGLKHGSSGTCVIIKLNVLYINNSFL